MIQIDEIKQFLNCDDQFLKELVAIYNHEISSFLDGYKNFVAKKDIDSIHQQAHKLLGTSKLLNTKVLTSVLEKLEIIQESELHQSSDHELIIKEQKALLEAFIA